LDTKISFDGLSAPCWDFLGFILIHVPDHGDLTFLCYGVLDELGGLGMSHGEWSEARGCLVTLWIDITVYIYIYLFFLKKKRKKKKKKKKKKKSNFF
jgi:hypothetical protein